MSSAWNNGTQWCGQTCAVRSCSPNMRRPSCVARAAGTSSTSLRLQPDEHGRMRLRTTAVFLDEDGTLIEDVPYNVAPEQIRLVPDAAEALHLLARSGYRLIVVSNQPGVALGMFPEYALRTVEQRLQELLLPAGVS